VGESRPSSVGPGFASGSASVARGSRPNSVLSEGKDSSVDTPDNITSPLRPRSPTLTVQTLSTAPLNTVYEFPPSPVKEVVTYSKEVQTSDGWTAPVSREPYGGFSDSEDDFGSPGVSRTPRNKRASRRQRQTDEEIRQKIRAEIEEELKAVQTLTSDVPVNGATQAAATQQNFPARNLTTEELNAVTGSDDFLDFVERSSKVIERALDQEYDVLADYALGGSSGVDGDEEFDQKKGVREIAQFWDERWSKKRMISAVGFSPKVSFLAHGFLCSSN
jgi:dynein intermediate chain, cytosolic